MFERFTDRARRVVVLSQEEARLLHHNYIGTEHILLGLLHESEGVAAQALESLGIGLEKVRREVEGIIGPGGEEPSGHVPFTPRAKKVLELSLREALQLGHNYIGTEHILLGLVREGEGVAAQVLVKLSADLSRVRPQVIQLLSGRQAPGESSTEGPSIAGAMGAAGLTSLVGSALGEIAVEAARREHDRVGTEHVLLWLLAHPEGGAARALAGEGVDVESLKRRLEQMLDDAGGSTDPAEPTDAGAPSTPGDPEPPPEG